MRKVYATKVDWWIGSILVLSVVVLAGTAFPLIIGPQGKSPVGWIVGLICLLTALWTAWIPFSTNYEITDEELIVRTTGIRWRIRIDSIEKIYPTHNPLSSPAFSLDRLHVDYHNRSDKTRFVMISPRDKDEFLKDLVAAGNGLQLKDGTVSRTAAS